MSIDQPDDDRATEVPATESPVAPLSVDDAVAEASTETATEPGRRIRRIVTSKPFIVGAAVAVVAAVVAAGVAVAMQPTAIERAGQACSGTAALEVIADDEDSSFLDPDVQDVFAEYLDGAIAVEDEGGTLILDTLPSDDDPLGISAMALECVEIQLEMPTWLTESISTTRALDGRQTGEWDGYSAQWTYHPDNGLNLVIVQG